jgi:hypothetical protein
MLWLYALSERYWVKARSPIEDAKARPQIDRAEAVVVYANVSSRGMKGSTSVANAGGSLVRKFECGCVGCADQGPHEVFATDDAEDLAVTHYRHPFDPL